MKYHWSRFRFTEPNELNAIYHTPSCLSKINNTELKYKEQVKTILRTSGRCKLAGNII